MKSGKFIHILFTMINKRRLIDGVLYEGKNNNMENLSPLQRELSFLYKQWKVVIKV